MVKLNKTLTALTFTGRFRNFLSYTVIDDDLESYINAILVTGSYFAINMSRNLVHGTLVQWND